MSGFIRPPTPGMKILLSRYYSVSGLGVARKNPTGVKATSWFLIPNHCTLLRANIHDKSTFVTVPEIRKYDSHSLHPTQNYGRYTTINCQLRELAVPAEFLCGRFARTILRLHVGLVAIHKCPPDTSDKYDNGNVILGSQPDQGGKGRARGHVRSKARPIT
ncbi:hypothetical protein BDZ91DRAFT_810749 [Kalaharituber pfeilii]|nr:hypothetical protein BDZ91DRAFT_810749 [Kalaharituber pfeilii]